MAGPANISMDLSRLNTLLGFTTTSFGDALRDVYAGGSNGEGGQPQQGGQQQG